MTVTQRERSREQTKRTECPVRASKYHARQNDRHYATRSEVLGTLAHGSKSLPEASRAITSACTDADLMRHPADSDRLIVISAVDDLDVLELLIERLERADTTNETLLEALTDRRDQLRIEAMRDE